MRIKLVCEVETRRWLIQFVDGLFSGRQGDYRITAVPESELRVGACFDCEETLPMYHQPTVQYYCGTLTIKGWLI